jgi:hypothetical protein
MMMMRKKKRRKMMIGNQLLRPNPSLRVASTKPLSLWPVARARAQLSLTKVVRPLPQQGVRLNKLTRKLRKRMKAKKKRSHLRKVVPFNQSCRALTKSQVSGHKERGNRKMTMTMMKKKRRKIRQIAISSTHKANNNHPPLVKNPQCRPKIRSKCLKRKSLRKRKMT